MLHGKCTRLQDTLCLGDVLGQRGDNFQEWLVVVSVKAVNCLSLAQFHMQDGWKRLVDSRLANK